MSYEKLFLFCMKPILKINETEEEEINESENVQQKINVVKPIINIPIKFR